MELLLGSQSCNKSKMNYFKYLDSSIVMMLPLIKTIYQVISKINLIITVYL